MNYCYSQQLGRNLLASRGDADALAYVAAVRAAGATVSGAQQTAINTFYVDAKAGSYYTPLKRLYLPIWGVAAANAIDMIGLTSGTFNGSVTHGAGFVQGDASTGYFDFGVDFTGSGMSQNSHMVGGLIYVADATGTGNRSLVGNHDTPQDPFLFNVAAGNHSFFSNDGYSALAIAPLNGILIGSRTGATTKDITHRGASGITTNSASTASIGTSGSTQNFKSMACHQGSATGYFSNAKLGSYFIGTGINLTAAASFSSAIKNLWETCTGLSLP